MQHEKQKIDWTKPIEIFDGSDSRKAFVKRVFNNGTALVAVDNEDDNCPIMFDDEGHFVGNPRIDYGPNTGSALTVRMNAPKPARFVLELDAKEAAFMRVLLGASCGNIAWGLFEALDDIVEISYEEASAPYAEAISIDNECDEFQRIIAKYEEAGREVDGQPFRIPRKDK